MAVSDIDIRRLRRMVNEVNDSIYSNDDLAIYLYAYPLVDRNGRTYENENWLESYDLHAAAADIWEEKAARVSTQHDFSADNSSFTANQMYENFMRQVKHHRANQKATVKRTMDFNRKTYYPSYANPIFDEDEPGDFVDTIL